MLSLGACFHHLAAAAHRISGEAEVAHPDFGTVVYLTAGGGGGGGGGEGRRGGRRGGKGRGGGEGEEDT